MDEHIDLFSNNFMNYMCLYLYKFINFKVCTYESGLAIIRMDCWDSSISNKLEEDNLKIYETYASAYEQFVSNKENVFNVFPKLRCNAVKREIFLDDADEFIDFSKV